MRVRLALARLFLAASLASGGVLWAAQGSAHADPLPPLPNPMPLVHVDILPAGPLLQVCLTVTLTGFHTCIVVPSVAPPPAPIPTNFVHVDVIPTGALLSLCITINELGFHQCLNTL